MIRTRWGMAAIVAAGAVAMSAVALGAPSQAARSQEARTQEMLLRAARGKRRLATQVVVLRLAVIDRPEFFYAYSRFVTPEVLLPAPAPAAAAPAAKGAEAPAAAPATQAEEAPAAARTMPASSALSRRCAACHGGAAPKGGLRIDGETPLPDEKRLAAIRRVLADEPRQRMPPNESLAPEELGLVLQELAGQGAGDKGSGGQGSADAAPANGE